MKVKLKSLDGEVGALVYDADGKGHVKYSFIGDDALSPKVDRYLAKKREYQIPESNDIDDYRVDVAIPTDNLTFFELALSTLFAQTGIRVGW